MTKGGSRGRGAGVQRSQNVSEETSIIMMTGNGEEVERTGSGRVMITEKIEEIGTEFNLMIENAKTGMTGIGTVIAPDVTTIVTETGAGTVTVTHRKVYLNPAALIPPERNSEVLKVTTVKGSNVSIVTMLRSRRSRDQEISRTGPRQG